MDELQIDRTKLDLQIEQDEIDKQFLEDKAAEDQQKADATAQLEADAAKPVQNTGTELKNAIVGGLAQAGSDIITLLSGSLICIAARWQRKVKTTNLTLTHSKLINLKPRLGGEHFSRMPLIMEQWHSRLVLV